jgi:hypothetical protein
MHQTPTSRIWLIGSLPSSSSLQVRVQTRLTGGRQGFRNSNCGPLAIAMRMLRVPIPSPLELREGG